VKRGAEASDGGRFEAIVTEHGLAEHQAQRLQRFLAVLAEDPHAPTAVRDPGEAVDVHLADSFAALPMLDQALDQELPPLVADVGSGAGVPGIPLAIARPAARFDLVEASQRKAGFLERVVERLDLSNAGVLRARAEELPGQGRREAYGVVVVRAVAPLATLVEYAAPLLAQGGRLLAWKGARDPGEEAAGDSAAHQLGLEPLEVRRVTPYSESRNRHLHLYQKVRPCPPEFPRRAGVARRRPLGQQDFDRESFVSEP
jgi:16S rRNA (guanine527-N7)-methyltransferase